MIKSKILEFNKDDEDFIDVLRFRYQVYIRELNYLKNDQKMNRYKIEFDDYDKNAKHIVLRNSSEIIAYSRIIHDDHMELPVLNKIGPLAVFDKKKTVEVSRLIVGKNYRNTKVIVLLLQSVFKTLLSLDCDYVVADTFQNTISHDIICDLGFKTLSFEYRDSSFELDVPSKVN